VHGFEIQKNKLDFIKNYCSAFNDVFLFDMLFRLPHLDSLNGF